MKRLFLPIVFSIAFIHVTEAQVKWGIGGGLHQSAVIEKNSIPGWDRDYKGFYSPRSGFHAGVFSEINLSKSGRWALQPALLYTNKGRNFSKSFDSTKSFLNDTSMINASWKINYLDLPVNVIYRLPITSGIHLVAGVGPYLSYNLNNKTAYELINASGERKNFDDILANGEAVNKYRRINWGVNASAGFDFNDRVLVTANYSRNISDFYTADYGGSFKHQVWGGTVVVWLTPSKSARTKSEQLDTDGDGVPDKLDKCPTEMGTAATNGCPDTDGDGIPDYEDKCPDSHGTTALLGCPVPDTDKDGVPDSEDECREVAGLAKYKGCPAPDTDGDGIDDENDKCPEVAGIQKYQGCPVPDTDGDGIDDENDKCPLKPGVKENNGCPLIAKDMVDEINKAAKYILFDVNSDNIKSSSFEALDKLADILSADPEMHLEIEGHTDNTGAIRLNQILSGRRALAIKTYLVNKGIAADRLTASGFGSERPIASNNTEAGRAKNRRVEFKVKY